MRFTKKLMTLSLGLAVSASTVALQYNDKDLYSLYALGQPNGQDTGADTAAEMLVDHGVMNNDPVIVAVVGTGVNLSSTDLMGRLVNTTGTGGDEFGWANLVEWSDNPDEQIFPHEDLVAHEIAAAANNQTSNAYTDYVGITGAAPIQVLPIKTITIEDQYLNGIFLQLFVEGQKYYYKDCDAFGGGETCLWQQIDNMVMNGDIINAALSSAVFTYYGVDPFALEQYTEQDLLEKLGGVWSNTILNPWVYGNRMFHAIRYAHNMGASVINVSSAVGDFIWNTNIAVLNKKPPVAGYESLLVWGAIPDGNGGTKEGWKLAEGVDPVEWQILAQGTVGEVIAGIMDEYKTELTMVTGAANSCTALLEPTMHPASLGFETFSADDVGEIAGALKHPNVVAVASVDMSGRLAIHDDVIDASGYIAHYTNVFPEEEYGVDWSTVTHLQYAIPGCGGNPSPRYTAHSNWVKAHLAAPGSVITLPEFNAMAGQNKFGTLIGLAIEGIWINFGSEKTYMTQGGTSFAAPYVSGALALAKLASPELSMLELRDNLIKGVHVTDQLNNWNVAVFQNVYDNSENPKPITVQATSMLTPLLANGERAVGGYLSLPGLLEQGGVLRKGVSHSDYTKSAFVAREFGASEDYVLARPEVLDLTFNTAFTLTMETQPSGVAIRKYDVLVNGQTVASYDLDVTSGEYTLGYGAAFYQPHAQIVDKNCSLLHIYASDADACRDLSLQISPYLLDVSSNAEVQLATYNAQGDVDVSAAQLIRLKPKFDITYNRWWFMWAMEGWNETVDVFYRRSASASWVKDYTVGAGTIYTRVQPNVGGQFVACPVGTTPYNNRLSCSNVLTRY